MSRKKPVPELEAREGTVMVCVTSQRQCDELIALGSQVADQMNAPMAVVSVQPMGVPDPASMTLMEYLMDVARQHDGELLVLYGNDPVPRLVEYAREHAAQGIVMGRARGGGPSAVVEALKRALPEVQIIQPEKN